MQNAGAGAAGCTASSTTASGDLPSRSASLPSRRGDVAAGPASGDRSDDLEHEKRGDEGYQRKIDDRILAEIRRARFVVADFSGASASVCYEAGFADGLGIPVIPCVREGEETKLSFDTRQVTHIVWSTAPVAHRRTVISG